VEAATSGINLSSHRSLCIRKTNSDFSLSRGLFLQIERSDDGLNVLHLSNVDHSQSGEVKCRVVCRDNRQIFNVYHTSLTVLPLPVTDRYEHIENFVENCSNKSSLVHDLTAYITKRPDDQTVLVGDSIQLDVEYYGVPEPTVRWMRAVSTHFLTQLVIECMFNSKKVLRCAFPQKKKTGT
jgi:hypothetical protein